jgi:predicted ester cyclase
VTSDSLATIYRSYIGCLNRQDWDELGQFVGADVSYNDRPVGLSGYRAMLERDFRQIPDLRFEIGLLICDPPYVASRLHFDCTPQGSFLGLAVDGRRVQFSENVFYRIGGTRIAAVWSVIDKAAIEAQLAR